MPTEYLFTTPIYYNYVPLEQVSAINKQIESVEAKVRTQDLANPWQDGVKTTFKYHRGSNDIVNYGLHELAKAIYENAAEYLMQIGVEKAHINITESWFNFCESGDYQEAHSHSATDICAVYFYKTNSEDGKLRFFSPSLSHSANKLLVMSKQLGLQDLVDYTPEVGKLIIFPGFLRHAVMQNKTMNERISIAANIEAII